MLLVELRRRRPARVVRDGGTRRGAAVPRRDDPIPRRSDAVLPRPARLALVVAARMKGRIRLSHERESSNSE